MKTLSIVIPVYNVEAFVGKCLDSVIYPERDDYEIIAVNDGSTDSSPRILEEYRGRYPEHIRIVTKENGGLGSARNAGIEVAQGEYLAFLDSDDWFSENAVPEMLKLCSRENFDICIFDFRAVNEAGKTIETAAGANRNGMFSLDSDPDLLLCRMNAWNKLYRRALFSGTGIRYPDRAWYEDVFTTPKLYTKAERILHEPSVWYCYLLREGSIMNNKNLSRNLEIIDAVTEMCAYYRERGLFDRFHDQLEYFSFYNVLLAATVRVNQIDPDSVIQDRLRSWFLENFPDYRSNPYVRNMSAKYKLLNHLIIHRKYRALRMVMGLNDRLRHQGV